MFMSNKMTSARTPMKKNTAVYVTCNQTFAMKNWLEKISRQSTRSSGEIIKAIFLEIERKQTTTFEKEN